MSPEPAKEHPANTAEAAFADAPALAPTDDPRIRERRERVFLVLAALFLGAMTLLNVIGITRFVHIGPLALAVGVLPYPLTFLCTDLISELYGKRRATFVVWVGFVLNGLVIATLWLGRTLPAVAPASQPPWQSFELASPLLLADGRTLSGEVELFELIYTCTAGAVFASMLAYLAAQLCDVHLFHFWKRLTRGRHLWLRNNASTVVSQLVDSVTVISVTFGAAFLRGEIALGALVTLLWSNYLFKLASALVDTGPFYLGVRWLSRYLDLPRRR